VDLNPPPHCGKTKGKTVKNNIILTNTLSGCTISRHRTVLAAVRAERRHVRGVTRRNGRGSYIPTSITSSSGEDIRDEVEQARLDVLYCGGAR